MILEDDCYSHVFFRCHDRMNFLRPDDLKRALLLLWAKYCRRYGVKIIEFMILDNHAHLIVKIGAKESLGSFMRTVNSQIARIINKKFARDSQAIKERYKSPQIGNTRYLIKAMQYVWLNRYKVDGVNPETDPFCSASWRIDPKMIERVATTREERESLNPLLCSYCELPFFPVRGSIREFVRELIRTAVQDFGSLCSRIFESGHTIGDRLAVRYRSELMSAFRRRFDYRSGWREQTSRNFELY